MTVLHRIWHYHGAMGKKEGGEKTYTETVKCTRQ